MNFASGRRTEPSRDNPPDKPRKRLAALAGRTATESQKAVAREKKDELDDALGDLNRSTNRLRRKFDPTDKWMETRPQVENVLDDARKINQVMVRGKYGYAGGTFLGRAAGKHQRSGPLLQFDAIRSVIMKRVSQYFLAAGSRARACGRDRLQCSGAAADRRACARYRGGIDRTVLPIAEPNYPHATELDARNAKAPPRFEVKAPQGAPNVIVFLIDDIGFGHPSTFGGAHSHADARSPRAARGSSTTASTPRRSARRRASALLTGRNHHTNNAGAIMEVATAFPGNTGARPQSVTPLAEILRQNGYSTAAFGKYHETAPWEVSVSGPFDRWPTHSGFDKFYGFIGGETNQWAPLDLRRHGQGGAAARPELPLHDRHDEPGDPVDPQPSSR